MLTTIYDGKCVICQSTRKTILTFDWLKRIEFLDLHDVDTLMQRYPNLEFDQLFGEIHVIEPQGELYKGFYGTKRMLKELPLGFPLWLLLQLPGMDWVGNKVYRWVARNRYKINKLFGREIPDCVDGVCKLH